MPNLPQRRAPRPGVRIRAALALAWGCTALLLSTGCNTPESRAKAQPGVFRALTTADQQLVRQGRIRPGFTKEAVRLAWGAPTEIRAGRTTGEPLDCWLYTHTFYGVTGGYYGAPRGLVYSHAEGRYRYDPDDFYEAPVYIRGFGQVSTDVPYRKAYFDGDRVVSFTTLHAGADSGAPGSR